MSVMAIKKCSLCQCLEEVIQPHLMRSLILSLGDSIFPWESLWIAVHSGIPRNTWLLSVAEKEFRLNNSLRLFIWLTILINGKVKGGLRKERRE
jgi:hypothetical protein